MILLSISWTEILEWLKQHLLTCPSKYFFHIDCPGCGMQRSILYLLQGDFKESLAIYPATIPIFALITFTLFHLKFNFKSGADVIKWGYIICTVIVMSFYIYKIINYKIFNL